MRTYGQGRVFLRGRVWWYEAYSDGERITRTSKSTKRADAVRLLNKLKADIERSDPVGRSTDRTTFEDLAKLILDDYAKNNRANVAGLRVALKHLREYFGPDCRAKDINGASIAAYQAQRDAKPATINHELSALRRAMNLGRQIGVVAIVPHFPHLRENNVRTGFFERREFEAVRDALPGYLRNLVTVAYHTGWRRGELVSRQRQHVDLSAGWIRLEPGETKNGEARYFPIPARGELRDALTDQLAYKAGTPWLFHRHGRRIGDFRDVWADACKAVNIDKKLFHDFRRTAVRNLERAGVPRSAAMKLTGHQTESVYRRYAIVDAGMLRAASDRLAAYINAETATPKPSGDL